MNAIILTIGDEILIGHTLDTNSGWMARELVKLGVTVQKMITLADRKEDIMEGLKEAEALADLVLITGGLGPTNDDLTRDTLCEYFNTGLVMSAEVLADLEAFFGKRGRKLTDRNKEQAMVPESCTVLRNPVGTAPGMWFERQQTIFVSMPGVPFEMMEMMENLVIPNIRNGFELPHIIYRHVNTIGIGESYLADLLSEFEKQLPVKLAYLPGLYTVRLRLTACGTDKERLEAILEEQVSQLKVLLADYIYSFDDETMEGMIASLLLEQTATLSTAESCTGGYIAHKITSLPGSSEYFKGTVVSYANEIKAEVLGVQQSALEASGAVSEPVVREMAAGVKHLMKTDYAIAVSGIAGPGGGSPDKPVGTVWIAVAGLDEVITRKYNFGKKRLQNIESTALMALNMLRKLLTRPLD